jgi:NodT family efflux transporter outer membrane factor (OMF) lipoprotein
MSAIRTAVLVALALGLSGCTPFREYVHNGFKVGPNYTRPPAPVAEHWIDAADVRVRSEATDDSAWWTVLNDPILNNLIETAYRQNLTLREAGFRVLQARAQLGIAVGTFFPQSQQAQGQYSRIAISAEEANRSFTLGRFFFTTDRFFDQWSYGFGLAWELDFWGRFRRAIEAADDNLDASVENYDDVLVTLLGQVATAYVQIRTLEQELVYVRTNIDLQRQTLDIARVRFKDGATTELDVDQAASTLAQTESQVPQLEISLRQANNQLCILLGIPPEDLHGKLGSGPIPTTPSDVVVGIPADLLRRRPDVRRQERLAAAQCAEIGVAEAEFYPAITISGSFGYAAQDFSRLFTSNAFQGNIGPSFQWNILNYGRILNNVRLQDARFRELVVTYQNTVLRAGEEVENGLVTFLRAQQQAKFLAESVAAQQLAVKVALAQYKGGLVDFNRVSVIEQNLVLQQTQLAQAQGSIALGLIQVYEALGGGWQIRCPPNTSGDAAVVNGASPAPSSSQPKATKP